MKTIQIEIPDGYEAKWVDGVLTLVEEQPKDITERIKTFNDACEWCTLNGKHNLVHEYDCIHTDSYIIGEATADLIAYLKLRIITCALNEGWEPTYERREIRYHYCYEEEEYVDYTNIYSDAAAKLCFKSEKLAEYAATQFKDIYMDFCYKGKE